MDETENLLHQPLVGEAPLIEAVPPEMIGLYDTMKRAFKDALVESKDVIAEIVATGIQGSQTTDKDEAEPYIGYHERHHRLKFVIRLVLLVTVGIIMSVLLVIVSGQVLATTLAVIFIWTIGISTQVVIGKITARLGGDNARMIKRVTQAVWAITILVLSATLGFLLVSRDVYPVILIVYAMANLVLLYVIAREYYKWSTLWFDRVGNTLIAERPSSIIFLLKKFHEELMLQKLDNIKETPSLLESILGIGRVFLNVAGEEDRYWNDLSFIAKPTQLIASCTQASRQARNR